MTIIPVSSANFSTAVNQLKQNNLPTEDISETTKLFVLLDDNKVSGTIAIEHSGAEGLLRSLSVPEEQRNNGLGIQLVNFIENYAQQNGVQNLYLLTTTAEKFFIKRAYEVVDRNEVPRFIQKTSEFSSVCPSSAIIMKKILV